MTFNDLLRVFWQRKLLIVVVMVLVIGPAYAATKLVSPQYESTGTLAVSPVKGPNDISAFLILDQVVPLSVDLEITIDAPLDVPALFWLISM